MHILQKSKKTVSNEIVAACGAFQFDSVISCGSAKLLGPQVHSLKKLFKVKPAITAVLEWEKMELKKPPNALKSSKIIVDKKTFAKQFSTNMMKKELRTEWSRASPRPKQIHVFFVSILLAKYVLDLMKVSIKTRKQFLWSKNRKSFRKHLVRA